MGLLGDIYSTIDSKKRQLKGLLADPVETLKLGLLNFKNDQNALLDTQAQAYPFIPRTQDQQARIPTFARTQEQARKELADHGANMGIAAATVWHGSPHKFDKFDSSKIGTGEGAQAYGHGLYLAENPKVADEYAGKLSKSIVEFKNSVPENEYERALQAKYQSLADRTQLGSKWEAIYNAWVNHANPVSDFLYGNSYAGVKPMSPEQLKTALAYRDAAKRLGEPVLSDTGSLYKVDLPDEAIAKMLDWDKPLSQQHPDVQKIFEPHVAPVRKMYAEPGDPAWGDLAIPSKYDPTGNEVLRLLNKPKLNTTAQDILSGGLSKDISEQLRQAGIPGIKYLDGSSRVNGVGTSNYVIFPGNEDLLTILERNGQGLLGQ